MNTSYLQVLQQQKQQKQKGVVKVLLFAILLVCTNFIKSSNATATECTSNEHCEELFYRYNSHHHDGSSSSSSYCLKESKTCSNVFHQGCLKAMKVPGIKKRVCNSNDNDDNNINNNNNSSSNNGNNNSHDEVDDEDELVKNICQDSNVFNYPEIRIYHGTRESSYILAWIYQILLMEIVGVPATVGLMTENSKFTNFYSINNNNNGDGDYWTYSSSTVEEYSVVEGLRVSNLIKDCRHTDRPCVHVLPEVWSGSSSSSSSSSGGGSDIGIGIDYALSSSKYQSLLFLDGTIALPRGNGMIGKMNLYIPAITARNFPTLTSFYGYQGNKNRALLAKVFPKPMTWIEYCQTFNNDTINNCTDSTSARYPTTVNEENSYFVEGLYSGYFSSSDITGYIIGPPCNYTAFVDSQLYWNGIQGLKQNGPIMPNGGYNIASMAEIWLAANATKSNVIMWGTSIDPISKLFEYTNYTFVQVTLPNPTMDCLGRRPTIEQRCSDNIEDRRGPYREGSCDYEAQSLHKIFSSSFAQSNTGVEEAEQSPGYDFLRDFEITELEMGEILQNWVSKGNSRGGGGGDKYGHDAREAVCEWVVENLDRIKGYIPESFPRTFVERTTSKWYLFFAQGTAIFTACVTCAAIGMVWKYRVTKYMVFAQPIFLFLILNGFFCTSIAAFLMVLRPTTLLCIVIDWLLVYGYTITLVPILVKNAAINQLTTKSSKGINQPVNLSRQALLKKVAVAVSLVVLVLTIMTLFDPPMAVYFQELSTQRDGDYYIVIRDQECESTSIGWHVGQIGLESVLLLMAAVLAYQSRNSPQIVNDSKSLGIMVYSHVVFVLLRTIFLYLDYTNALTGTAVVTLFSFNYTLDALFAMIIYIFPKIYKAKNDPEDYRNQLARGLSQFKRSNRSTTPSHNNNRKISLSILSEESEDSKDDLVKQLRILICTSNMGNAEPTEESLKAWLPIDGSCNKVTPLDGVASLGELSSGIFDLIVIGMQESTWKVAEQANLRRQSELSEEDFLYAMEDQNTARLRERVSSILGESYCQVVEERRGQMRMHVWASEKVLDDIADIRISGANTGVGNVLANKGGIVVTLRYRETEISFMSAHLAAHEGESYFKTRCQNIRKILREAKTSKLSSKLDITQSSHHTFIFGDLNFRTKFKENDLEHQEKFDLALKMIDSKDYAGLYALDELQEAIDNSISLVDFKTPQCLFPPTFKVERDGGFVYKTQRVPSYTDRILYKCSESIEDNLKLLAYEPCVGFTTSDHKPLRGAFNIVPNQEEDEIYLEGRLHLTFKNFACSDLPSTDSNDLADPYLMIMWENDFLEEDSFDIRSKFRRLFLGYKTWPRLSFQMKTLNPDWKGDEIRLSTRKGSVGVGTRLFIVMVDWDAFSKDDFMCATSLNLTNLVTMEDGQREKTIPFYRYLKRNGRNAGRIKFTVDVKREKYQRRRNYIFRPSQLS